MFTVWVSDAQGARLPSNPTMRCMAITMMYICTLLLQNMACIQIPHLEEVQDIHADRPRSKLDYIAFVQTKLWHEPLLRVMACLSCVSAGSFGMNHC